MMLVRNRSLKIGSSRGEKCSFIFRRSCCWYFLLVLFWHPFFANISGMVVTWIGGSFLQQVSAWSKLVVYNSYHWESLCVSWQSLIRKVGHRTSQRFRKTGEFSSRKASGSCSISLGQPWRTFVRALSAWTTARFVIKAKAPLSELSFKMKVR